MTMKSLFDGITIGAEWQKCALQVNPYSYLVENNCVPAGITDEDAYNRSIVDELMAQGIGVIAITDHWCVDSGATLKTAAEAAGIVAFPGFEATAKDGVHLLMIFDPATGIADINRFIGQCGIPADCKTSVPGDLDTESLLEHAEAWGAVVVAPHATTGGGLLDKLSGQSAVRAWTNPKLHAVAPGGTKLSQAQQAILDNKDKAYKRDNPVAIVNAADVRTATDLAKPGTVCWIKLSSVSVVGLDLAFRTPETRVSRTDPTETSHPRIIGIAWEGGFLDGMRVPLNESLNVLIGGRGSGKSTLIESLRFALGALPLAASTKADHQAMVKEVLKPGTKVLLEVQTRTPSQANFLIERIVGSPPVVRDATGAILTSTPLDILAGVEIYGQRELAELARNKKQLTELLARYLPDVDARASQAEGKLLADSRSEIISAMEKIDDLENRLARVPIIKERLKAFDEAGVADKLNAQTAADKEQLLLEGAKEAVNVEWDPAGDLVDIDQFSDGELAELPEASLLKDARQVLIDYNSAISTAFSAMATAQATADSALLKVEGAWETATSATRKSLDKILRELQPEGVDGDEYLRLNSELSQLKPLEKEVRAARAALKKLKAERATLLQSVLESRASRLRSLEREAKKVRRRLPGIVQATVLEGEDRSPLTKLLDERIGGRLDTVRSAVNSSRSVGGPDLANLCRQGRDAIMANLAGVSSAQATQLASADEDTLMALEEVELPVSTDLELNVGSKSDPIWRNLDRLSTGQKATALLLLLMERGSGPLVIDQPEDDLDNRFIFEDIVPRLRKKGIRQVVFSSHNANIPVLGDADQIAAMETMEDGSGVVGALAKDGLGSIDHEPVRRMVEEVLEGGREAFITRRYLYGF